MKKLFLLFFVLTTCIDTFSQTPQADWVHDYGGSVEAIHIDNSGYIFTGGTFYLTATFGTTTLDAQNGGNAFLYKSDASGNILWVKQYGHYTSGQGAQLKDVKTDAAGNIYIYGRFNETITMGSTTLTSSGATDLFLCKLDATGNVLWAKKYGNAGYEIGYNRNMEVDASGNVYIGARFQLSITIGSTTYNTAGLEDLIFMKINTNGNVVWSKKFGGTGRDENHDVAVDAAGNTYYVGSFANTVVFGSTSLTATGASDFYILKLSPIGDVVWAKKMNGSGADNGIGIQVTSAGIIYVSGTFMGTLSFGGFSVSSSSSSNVDAVFSKLDANGNVLWLKNIGSTVNAYNSGISVKPDGNIVLSGEFTGTSVGGASAGSFDVYVAEYTPAGAFLWGKKYGGTEGDLNSCHTIGPDNAIYIGGFFTGTVAFDSYTVTTGNNYTSRGYLVRLSNCNPTTHTITETACGSFELNNETFTTSGTYTQVLENAAGCDSTITLNLTINQPTTSSTTITECGQYIWPLNSQTYTTSGTYTHVIPNANNCDSTVTLNLTINQPSSSSTTVTECGQYIWTANNQTYTTSGTYTHVIPNANNCDSTITLNLIINQPSSSSTTVTECGQYTWTANNQTYTASGTYTHVIPNADNCDSTITLNLTINAVNAVITSSGSTLIANPAGATYQWIDCGNNNTPVAGAISQLFTPTQNGSYAVTVTANGCTETSSCMPVNFVGIESLEQTEWSIYPNPSSGVFTISSSFELNDHVIEVYSALGELVYSTTYSGKELLIDLSEQPTGVYTVRVNRNQHFRIVMF